MLELLLVAQATLSLYEWSPADGPVVGYHVYVDGHRQVTVYDNEAWLQIEGGQLVEVAAVDADLNEGPLSPASEPNRTPPSCVLRDAPNCMADFDQNGWVSAADYLTLDANYGRACSCDGDLDGDLFVGPRDVALFNGLYGGACE